MDPKDFLSKYLRDDLTEEDMESQIQEAERKAQFDYVIKGGQVYFNAEELIRAMDSSARFTKLICSIKGDMRGVVMSEGIGVCADVVRGANSELLRREAEKSLGE